MIAEKSIYISIYLSIAYKNYCIQHFKIYFCHLDSLYAWLNLLSVPLLAITFSQNERKMCQMQYF